LQRNGKIQPIEELSATLAACHTNGTKLVLCHGVFDLLHIGHIRHLEQARKLGDVLVVTLTADQYVNRGPHRPAFHEDLRAEALAALECVDYVAITKWPTAVEAIRLLRPGFYVKGAEGKDVDLDGTDSITHEETAVKSVGGQLVFTEDITYSSSSLINKFLPVFPKEVSEYLAHFSTRYSAGDVLRYLRGARPLKVLVVGEAIIDEYQYCEAIGKSSKEPTLVVKYLSTEKFAGGILAAGNHVANFCDDVGLITFLGADAPQEEFIRERLNNGIQKTFLYRQGSPTIVKRRFVESYFFTKLLEIYEINTRKMAEEDNANLCAALNAQVSTYDVVIVIDFGHGMLSGEAIDILCDKARFLAVNAQTNAENRGYHTISRYRRADYICMAESEIRLEARDRSGDLRQMVLDVSRKLACGKVAVTGGKRGCLCYGEDEGFFEVPAFAGQIVDRIGAGDAFLSLTALCVAQKAPMEVVGFIGNCVGAQAVATVGNRQPIERGPLFSHIESLLK
jgi:rfaE bifunctional protein nucleotidyltransferase chain/domain